MDDLIKSAKKQRIQRFAVGAVIAKNSKILFLKRSDDDFMPGIYELPSGKVEENETLEQALKREIKEETNLNVLKVEKYISHFDYFSKSGKQTRQFNFEVSVKNSENIVLTEHTEYVWISKNELNNYNITDAVKQVIKLL